MNYQQSNYYGGDFSDKYHTQRTSMYAPESSTNDVFGHSMKRMGGINDEIYNFSQKVAYNNENQLYGNMFQQGPGYIENRITTDRKDIIFEKDLEEKKENFEKDTSLPEDYENEKHSSWLLLLLFILLFIAIDYWVRSANSILSKYLLKVKKLKPVHLIIMAVFFTLTFVLIANYSGISLRRFEIL